MKFVGISHFHADHTGQLAPLPNATLLIGKGDWDGAHARRRRWQGANVAGFKHWISGGGKVEPLTADKDVFGDGTRDDPAHARATRRATSRCSCG